MKCQKNRVCKKQPENSLPPPKNAKFCTGCDKPSKDVADVKPKLKKARKLSAQELRTNINILNNIKDSIFQGNHSGIDHIVSELWQNLEKRK